jgi:hypothetical protein
MQCCYAKGRFPLDWREGRKMQQFGRTDVAVANGQIENFGHETFSVDKSLSLKKHGPIRKVNHHLNPDQCLAS